MANKNDKGKITRGPLNVKNNWFKNVIKSMGYTGIDIIKDVAPSTSEFISESSNVSMDIVNSMRSKVTEEKFMDRTMDQISPLVKMSSQGLKNALEDIKTGKFYNKEREQEYLDNVTSELEDDMFGDFDDNFDIGDEFDDSDMFFDDGEEIEGTPSEPKVQPVKIVNDISRPSDFLPAAQLIAGNNSQNTMAAVESIQGLGKQQKAFQIQSMMRDESFNNSLLNSLASINDNLSSVLKIKTENESKFISVGMEFFGDQIDKMDELIKNTKGDDRTPEEIKDDNRAKDRDEKEDIFMPSGVLDIEAYLRNIKSNLMDIDEFEMIFDTANDLFTDEDMMNNMIASPLSYVMKGAMKSLIPKIAQDSIKLFDDTLSSIFPAIMAKINKLTDADLEDDSAFGVIKSYIGKIFGYDIEKKTSADLGNYEKGPVPFDGVTKKTIVDVIPTYLRRIESAITGTSERFYNYDDGKFTTLDEIKNSYDKVINRMELSGYSDIVNSINASLNTLNLNNEDRESFEKDLLEYFKAMNLEGKSINPFNYVNREGETVDELYENDLFTDDDNKDLFRRLLKEMNNTDLMKMMGSDIFESITSKNKLMQRIEKDNTLYGYKYLYDESLIEDDYEVNDNGKKVRKKVFGNIKDKFGKNNLDYLRDIKSILLNGIKVFIAGDITAGAITDPNQKFRNDMRNEENDYEEQRRFEQELRNTREDQEDRQSILDITEMSDRDLVRRTRGEHDFILQDYLNDLADISDDNNVGPIKKLKNKLGRGIVKVTEGPAEKFNDMVYKLIFGSEEERPDTEESDNLFDKFKTKISAFHSWTITSVYNPIKESLIGENGIITKIGQSKVFKKLTDKKNDIINYLFGSKNEEGLRQGGFLSGLYNKSKDMIKSVGHYFTGKEYTDSEGNVIADDDNALFRKAKRTIKNTFEKGKEKLSDIPNDFMMGYYRFRESLFGKASEAGFKKQTMQEFADDIKSKLPKAVGTGLLAGVGKAVLFSKAGLLGSLFMPGGAIGAMITGTAASFLMQSDKFKNWLFGEKDPDDPNKRLGGFIPKSLQDLYNENKMQIKVGGAIGAGVGLLPSFFLPGGPLTGAILGIGAGLVTKSDAFQEFLYGEHFKDGNKKLMNGAFGKAFAKGKEVFDKYGVDPKQATFLGGIGAAAGALGLLPTFFLPGGPIGGALLGMAGGIVASSNKFQEFLLGEKQWDGKRHGGLITKFSTWFDIHVVDSLKITMKEWNMKVSDFLYDSIAEPFLKAAGPVTRAMQDAAEKVKDIFKAGWDKINENVVGVFKDNVIKPFGESLEKYIVNPLKKFLTKGFNLAGKILGTIVSAPFKLFGAIGNRLDKKIEKNAVKDEKEKRRSEAYNNIKNDIKSGNFSFKDLRQNIRNAKLSKEEREELIKDATAYRDKYEKGKEARDAKRNARREKLQSEIDELKANQKKDSEFFKKNGKFRNQAAEDKWNQQQKEKQAWYQQHIAESGMETVEKLDEINKAMKDLQDSPRILSSMEEGLLNELRNLKNVMEEQLAYFKQEGFVDTSYLRRKKEKPEPVQPNIHFNMNKDITSKPEVSPMFKNINNISNEAKKKQDPRINNIIDILRRNGQSHAEGLDIVPYDGYVAELHKGERIVPGDKDDINVKGEKEKFKMLNSIKRHTRMIADEIKGQLYGVGSNLHHIRKILQHMSGLKDDDVSRIKDQNIPDGGGIGKFIHDMKVKIGSPVDTIKNALMKPFNWISEKLTSIKEGFKAVFDSVKEIPGKIVDQVGTAINTVLSGITEGLSIAFKGAAQIAVKTTSLAISGVSTVVSDLYKGSRFLVTTIAKSFVPVLKGAGKAVGAFAEGIGKASKLAIDAIVGLGKGAYTVTKDLLGFGYNLIKDVIKGGVGVVKGIGGATKAVFGGGIKFAGNIFGAAKSAVGGKTKEAQEVRIVGGVIDKVTKVDSIEEINLVGTDEKTVDEKIRSNISKMKLGETLEQTSNAIKDEAKNQVIVLKGKLDAIGSMSSLGNIENIVRVRVVNPEDMKQSTEAPTINSVKSGGSTVVNVGNIEAIKGAVVEAKPKETKQDAKEAYRDQIKEQMKAEKEKEKEEEAKADRAHVSRLSADYVQEQKRIKKEQLLETQYKEETMKDIDSTDKTLTKQYDFWYDLFGKNGKIHTKLKNLWEMAKKLFPMLLSWFKGTSLFNTLSKIFGGTGLGNLAGSIATALAPSLVGLIADQIDKKEREERADEYNISDYDAYVGQGKESRWDGEEYVLNGDRISAKYNLLGQQAIKIAKSDLGQKTVQVGKNIYNNAKPYIEKATSKVTNAGSKIMEKGGTFLNSIKSKLGFGGTKNVTETGMSVVNFGTSEILDEAGNVISEGKYRVIDVADDVAKNNNKFFTKLLTKGKEALVKLFEFVGSKLGNTKLAGKALELIGPILSKLKGAKNKIIAKFGSKIATFFGEKVAGMITLGVVEAGFAIWNAGTGLTKGDTANLFGVKTDQVDWKMRVISAALKTATNLSWIGVIYLINEILADVFDINLLRWVAGIIYKFVASVKDSEELKENQDQMKEDWKAYNAENGTNMSFEAYMDKQSPTTADNIVNSDIFKNFRATFDKGSAANALGKNKEDVNLWDRIKFGAGHTVNNVMNLFRKDKKTDAEFFQGKEQVVDEKGNAVLDKDGKPQYKSVKKETDKKNKKTNEDEYAGMGDGPSSEVEAIQNGFAQESQSTSNWLDMKTKEHKTIISSIAAGFNSAKATIMGWYTSQDDDISKTFKKKKSKINILDRKLWGQLKAFNWAANLFRDDTRKLSTKEEVENIMKHFKNIGDSMSSWLKAKTENIKKIIDAVGRGFTSVKTKFTDWWTGNDENIAQNTGKDPEKINNWDRVKDKVTGAIGGAWNWLTGLFKKKPDTNSDVSAINNKFNSINNGGTVIDTTNSTLSQTDDTSTEDTPAYAQGTPWIPETQVALVHEGEMVIPAEKNPMNPANFVSYSQMISDVMKNNTGVSTESLTNTETSPEVAVTAVADIDKEEVKEKVKDQNDAVAKKPTLNTLTATSKTVSPSVLNIEMSKDSNLNIYGLDKLFERLQKEYEKQNGENTSETTVTSKDNKKQTTTTVTTDKDGKTETTVTVSSDKTTTTNPNVAVIDQDKLNQDTTSTDATTSDSSYYSPSAGTVVTDTSTEDTSSTSNDAYIDISEGTVVTDDTSSTDAYIDTDSYYESSSEDSSSKKPKKLTKLEKTKQMIERRLPRDKDGNVITGDPLQQNGYYTSEYLKKTHIKNTPLPNTDPATQNGLVTSYYLTEEARKRKKQEEDAKKNQEILLKTNTTGAQVQRDINAVQGFFGKIADIPVVRDGLRLFKNVNSNLGGGRDISVNSLIDQKTDTKNKSKSQETAGKGDDTPTTSKSATNSKNTSTITNPLAGVFSFFGNINKGMKNTGTGRDGQYTSSKSVEKSAKEAKEETKKMYDSGKKSWTDWITGEDSEVRKMFNISDKDKKPSMGQRALYNLTKPITDMVNDITGKNELSYGAGGKIVRDKFGIVSEINKSLGKSDKDKTKSTVTKQDNAVTRFVQKTQDLVGDITKGLGRTDKDKTKSTVTKQDNAVTRFIGQIGDTFNQMNKSLGKSDKDKTKSTVTKQDNAVTRFIGKTQDLVSDITKGLGRTDKDKTKSTVTKQDNAVTKFMGKIGDTFNQMNKSLTGSDRLNEGKIKLEESKLGKNIQSFGSRITKGVGNITNAVGKTFNQMNKSLTGSDRLNEGKIKPENTKIKKSIQNIGNSISKGVGTATKVFKEFASGLNKTSKDLDKNTLKDETNPFKTAVQNIGKKMNDGIKGMGDAYNKFKNGIVNKITGTAKDITEEGKKIDKKQEKTTGEKTIKNKPRVNTRDYRNRNTVIPNKKKTNTNNNKKKTTTKKKTSTPKKQSIWSKIKNGVKSFFGFGGSDTKPLNEQVKPKNYVFSELDYEYLGDNKGDSIGGLRDIGNTHNYAYYSQLDERWSENKIGNKNNMALAGCGPTSAAMVLTQMTGQRITPDTMAKIGTKYLTDYTTKGYFPEIASQFKLNYDEINSQDVAKLKTALKNNQGVVLAGVNKGSSMMTPFTKEGHIVVATGIKGDKIQINDPRGPGYSGEYSINDVMRALNGGYTLEATQETMKLELPSSGKYGKNQPKPKAKYTPKDIVEKAKQEKEEIQEKLNNSNAMKALKRVTNAAKDKAKEVVEKVKDNKIVKKVTDTVKNVKDKVVDKALELKDKIVNSTIGKTITKVVDKVKNNKIVKKVTDTVKKGVNTVKEKANDAKNWVFDKLGLGGENTTPLRSQVKAKNYVFEDSDYEYSGENKGGRIGGLRDVGNTHNFAYYSQLDERWSGDKTIGGSTIGEAGCGPTSAAMVLTQITGQRITPDTMAQIGSDYLPGYASYSYFPEIATKFKLNYSEIQPEEESSLRQTLQNKKPVILSGFNRSDSISSPYTKQGHIVVATGIKGDNVQINDPRGPGYSGEYKLNDIMRGMKRGIVLSATRDTLKTGIQTSGKYSNVYLNDEYTMSGDTPDFDGLSEIFGTAGTKTVTNIPGAKIATNKNDDKTKENNTDDKKSNTNTGGKIRLWEKVVGYAKAFLGKLQYSYGSGAIDNNGKTTDCSHFTAHVINRAAEMNIPPGSAYQKNVGEKTTNPQPGDLVVWDGHAGLVYDTKGNMIDAGSGTVPKIRPHNNKHWTQERTGRRFRRVLKNPNELVDPKVKNYHTGIGFNGIVDPKTITDGGTDVEAGQPSNGNSGDSTLSSGGSSASAIPELGVFDKLSQGFTNIVASMYNGKQVDLFANSGDTNTGDGTTPGGQTPTGTGNFPKYQLNDAQIKGLANILDHEQPGTAGIYAEASIMANLNDIKGDHMATTENLLKRAVYGGSWGGIHLPKGWFAYAVRRFENPGNPSKTAIQAIKDVIIGGKRTLPRYVDEHDSLSDITSVTNNGAAFNKTNRSAYKPHVTKFHNRWGASGTFYSFPGPGTDPFFYTSDSYRKKWGENCYSVGGGSTSTNDNGAGMGEGYDDEFIIFPEEEINAGMGPSYDSDFERTEYKELNAKYGDSAGMDAATQTAGGIPYTLNNYAYFAQTDSTWGSVGGTSISRAGCGPTSLAIIATQLTGKLITPKTMATAAKAAGHWGSSGAQWSLFPWFANKFGMQYKTIGENNISAAKEQLKAGHPIAVSGRATDRGQDTTYTPKGHIVPFVGIDSSSNNIIVNDPRGTSRAHAYTDAGLAKGTEHHLRQGWAFIPPATVPSDIATSGDYNGSTGAVTNLVTGSTGDATTGDGTTEGESAAPAIPELGVFEKLSQGFTNVITSMYNGKQVDLFASSGSTDTSTDTSNSDGTNPDISGQDTSDVNGRKKAVWTFFTSKGYSKEATAGIMGNMHTETGGTYSPSIIQGNGRGPAAGICQWENYNTKSARWKEMSDYAASKGKQWTDMQSQLEFIDMELSGRSKDTYTNSVLKKKVGGYEQYKQLNNVEKAVMAFEQSFERAGVKAYNQRIKYGQANYNQFANAGTGPDAVLDFTRLTFDDNAGMGDWTYYDQTDPKWNVDNYDGNTIDKAGCGPTSLAMAASNITGEEITPDMIASEAYDAGVWSDSSSWDIFPWFAKKMHFDSSRTTKENDLRGISNMLSNGETVVASGISSNKKSPFTKAGHIVSIVGRSNNGNFIINDPRGKKFSGEYKPEDIVGEDSLVREAWGYKQSENKINKLSNMDSKMNKQMTAKELYANAGKGEEKISYTNNITDNTTKVVKETTDFSNLSIPETVKQILNDTELSNKLGSTSEMNYVRACLESLNVAVSELKSINTNTRETADNVSQIKVYSANEPVRPITQKAEDVESKKSNNFYKKSKTIASPESNEYYIARKIASFNK